MNFLLCERILTNVKTKRQANLKILSDLGLVEQKNVENIKICDKFGCFKFIY
jgi:hypothetical protein